MTLPQRERVAPWTHDAERRLEKALVPAISGDGPPSLWANVPKQDVRDVLKALSDARNEVERLSARCQRYADELKASRVALRTVKNGEAVRSEYGWPTAAIALAAQTECECDGPVICAWCMSGCPTTLRAERKEP